MSESNNTNSEPNK
jgi:hypothetical protein